MWRPKIMAQIVHRNHLFAVCFNLAYFVSGCNDNWIRLQGTGNLLVNCSLYLPSVYGSRSNIFHPEVSCVPREASNSKNCNQKDAIQISNVCSLSGTKGLPCGLQIYSERYVVCSCRKLLFSSLWSTCPVNPISSSMLGTLVGTWWCCLLKKLLGVGRLVPDTTKKNPLGVLHPYIAMCNYMFWEC